MMLNYIVSFLGLFFLTGMIVLWVVFILLRLVIILPSGKEEAGR